MKEWEGAVKLPSEVVTLQCQTASWRMVVVGLLILPWQAYIKRWITKKLKTSSLNHNFI